METLPLQKVSPDSNLMVRDVATVQTGAAPGQIDRSAMQRYLSITANVEGEDLGRATGRIAKAIAAAGEPPRGVRVMVRGQVAPMTEMFQLAGRRPGPVGGGDPGHVDRLLPVVPAGTGVDRRGAGRGLRRGRHPLATGTTLNIESFMGSIMCIGVSVSNSVMLSTFMDDHWRAGATVRQAADRRGPATGSARS